jgi:archaellum biogenesis protein FlaJ (TadC family)
MIQRLYEVGKMKNYYHKYFEDFEEERVPNRDGKGTHIEHKYVGYYYRLGVKNAVKFALRTLYLLLGAVVIGCLLFASTRMAHYNTMPYSVVLQAITLLAILWFLWVLIYYILSPNDMTVYKYKSTALQMIKVCKWLTVAFLLNAILVIADMVIFQSTSREQSVCLAAYLLGGILILGLKKIEQALPYERLSNDREIIWYREKMVWR